MDSYWNKYEDEFYFGFDTMYPWYRKITYFINNLFPFLQIRELGGIGTNVKIGYKNLNLYKTVYRVFYIEYLEEMDFLLKRQYNYICHCFLRLFDINSIGDGLVNKLYNNKTKPVYLITGLSNSLGERNYSLSFFKLKSDHILNLNKVKRAEFLLEKIPVFRQSHFILFMNYNIEIPEVGDVVIYEEKEYILDTVFSPELIRLISLDNGKLVYTNLFNIIDRSKIL
jgi:hypothetical protein